MTENESDDGLERLLVFIRDSRAIDFTGYKRSSLSRRINKRMQDRACATFDDYRDLLETNAEEFRYLLDTLLINVTGFFRDPNAWEYLRNAVVPTLIENKGSDDEIRVWSAGCSTGEEAYSLAIVFAETLGTSQFYDRVKIYGTDIDEEALRIARQGVYSPKTLEPLPDELVRKYFEPTGSSFVVTPEMRRRVIYGRHDISRDAPISRLDLLCCRNVLMYFNAETQGQILDRFHFALADHGVLFLGKAEMLLSNGERFEAVNMPNRVFRRREGARGWRPIGVPVTFDTPPNGGVRLRQRQLRDGALDTAPTAHILIDVNGTVVLVNNKACATFGLTNRDEGRLLRDLEISYRPVELRSLIEQAQRERRTVRINAVERALGPNDTQYFDVQVQPLVSDDGQVLGVDITFSDTTTLVRLQDELKRHREDLETAYEELQSTNEELETTNEELQSSIEELETTNEELQSTNEELETMNEELRTRTEQLDTTTEFLSAVLNSAPSGLIVLDSDLRVQSWNAAAEELWGLRANEVDGTAFFMLDFGLPTTELREIIKACFDNGESQQTTIAATNRLGRPVSCDIVVSPLGRQGDGVVISMTSGRREEG